MKVSVAARRRSRQFLVQALYQAQLTGTSCQNVITPFMNDHNMKRADLDYFREMLEGIGRDEASLVQLVESKADRPFTELDPVEKGILLLGTHELKSRNDVPYKVVINEAVNLARSFGATDSYRYVNSVLDALSRELRPDESASRESEASATNDDQ